jgi:hypothetical protein
VTLTAALNIKAMASDTLGECPSNAALDPFATVLTSLAAQVKPLPYNQVMDALNGPIADTIELRRNTTDIIVRAANGTGTVFSDFLREEAAGSLNCAGLHEAVHVAKDAVCCNLTTPLFWYVSAWYLAAWAMLLCGLPAGILGRKRLTSEPWGPAYQDIAGDVIANRARRAADERARATDVAPKKWDAFNGGVLQLRNVNTKRGAAADFSSEVDGGDFRSGRPSEAPAVPPPRQSTGPMFFTPASPAQSAAAAAGGGAIVIGGGAASVDAINAAMQLGAAVPVQGGGMVAASAPVMSFPPTGTVAAAGGGGGGGMPARMTQYLVVPPVPMNGGAGAAAGGGAAPTYMVGGGQAFSYASPLGGPPGIHRRRA